MKKFKMLLLLMIVSANTVYASSPVELTIMSYNIYSARNSSNESISEVIRRHNPDLVSLQEVERNTELNPEDVPALIAEFCGMGYHYFVHALDLKEGGEYGNTILSKHPIIEGNSFKLGTEGRDYIRSFGYVEIEKDGQKVHFGATHLDHRSNDSLRLVQAKTILSIIEQIGGVFFIAGDMNATPHTPTIGEFKRRFMFGAPDAKLEFTVPVPNPEKTIDYIIYSPAEKVTVKSYAVDYSAASTSDHYPVVATFTIHSPFCYVTP